MRYLTFIFICISLSLKAQKSAVFVKDSAAVRGYDVVAYFTRSRPEKGSAEFMHEWKNSKWYFANKAHLDAFKANPEKYAPEYGGYCAYGTADGHKAPTDPEAWTIIDGKLYLNYNQKVMSLWRKDQAGFIEKANKNWPLLKDKE